MTRPAFNTGTVDYFTQGECGALAVRLHELTGWPVCGVVEGTPHGVDPDLRVTRGWSHALVRTPEGLYLDVTGARIGREVEKHWLGETVAHHVGSVQERVVLEVRDHWGSPYDDYTPRERRARACRMAQRLLRLYQQHRSATDFVPVSWWTRNPEFIGMG